MIFFGKVSWTSPRYFWAETPLGNFLVVHSLVSSVRRHKILVPKTQLLCLQLACGQKIMLIPVWICSLVKAALYCQKPLSYYVSQSDSRTYNTAPLETIKSILKQTLSHHYITYLNSIALLYDIRLLYENCLPWCCYHLTSTGHSGKDCPWCRLVPPWFR